MTSSLKCYVSGTFALIASIGLSEGAVAQTRPVTCDLDEKAAFVGSNPSEATASFFDMLSGEGCFGVNPRIGESCQTSDETDPLCGDIKTWQPKDDDPKLSENKAAIDEAFDLLARIESQGAALKSRTSGALNAAATRFAESLETFAPLSSDDFREALTNADTQLWTVDPEGNLFGPNGINPSEILSDACSGPTIDPDHCERAFIDLGTLYTLAGFQHTMMSTFFKEDRAAFDGYLTELDRKWSTYFSKSRGILPWELYANGLLFKPERGFNEPPSSQLILLHPNVGLRAGDGAGGNIDTILTLELVGYYDWRWEDGDMKAPFELPGFLDDYPLGGSLVIGFDGDDDPGFGGVLHLPRNWSVGAMVDTEGDVTALISVDIAKLELFTGDSTSLRKGLVSLFKGL